MCIKRDKPGGLGLSVKGGAEHNLPILVSRIFKDQAGTCRPAYLLGFHETLSTNLSHAAVKSLPIEQIRI